MKTTAEIMDILNKRKNLYEEKQNKRKKTLKIVSAVAAALILFTALPVGAVIISRQAKQPAEIPAPEQTAAAAETPETSNTSVPDTDRVSSPTVDLSEIPDDDYEDTGKPTDGHFEPYLSYKYFKNEKEIVCLPKSYTDRLFPYHIGIKQEDAVSFEVKLIGDFRGFRNLSVTVESSDGVEVLSEKSFIISEEDGVAYPSFIVSFRYKGEQTAGCLKISVDQKSFFENSVFRTVSRMFLTARIKGIDFVSQSIPAYPDIMPETYLNSNSGDGPRTILDALYRDAAQFFGDTDENGYPLYMKDPYMQDYRSYPLCRELRMVNEARSSDESLIENMTYEKDYVYIGGKVGYDENSKYAEASVPLNCAYVAVYGFNIQNYIRQINTISISKTNDNGDYFISLNYEDCKKYDYIKIVLTCECAFYDDYAHNPFGLLGDRQLIDTNDFGGGSIIDLGYYDLSTGIADDTIVNPNSENESIYKVGITEPGNRYYDYYKSNCYEIGNSKLQDTFFRLVTNQSLEP